MQDAPSAQGTDVFCREIRYILGKSTLYKSQTQSNITILKRNNINGQHEVEMIIFTVRTLAKI